MIWLTCFLRSSIGFRRTLMASAVAATHVRREVEHLRALAHDPVQGQNMAAHRFKGDAFHPFHVDIERAGIFTGKNPLGIMTKSQADTPMRMMVKKSVESR
jgi:hypothetical protein